MPLVFTFDYRRCEEKGILRFKLMAYVSNLSNRDGKVIRKLAFYHCGSVSKHRLDAINAPVFVLRHNI